MPEKTTENRTSQESQDLVVFDIVRDSECAECRKELLAHDFLFMEDSRPLCLTCADLDHLTYLPRGDTALTRRSRKNSSLSAVVVRFSRARKRYERQGVLVEQTALDRSVEECRADAGERAGWQHQEQRPRLIEPIAVPGGVQWPFRDIRYR